MREETITLVQYFDNAGVKYDTKEAALEADARIENTAYFSIRHCPELGERRGFQRVSFVEIPKTIDSVEALSWVRMWANWNYGNEITSSYGCGVLNWYITPIDQTTFVSMNITSVVGNDRYVINKIQLQPGLLRDLL